MRLQGLSGVIGRGQSVCLYLTQSLNTSPTWKFHTVRIVVCKQRKSTSTLLSTKVLLEDVRVRSIIKRLKKQVWELRDPREDQTARTMAKLLQWGPLGVSILP